MYVYVYTYIYIYIYIYIYVYVLYHSPGSLLHRAGRGSRPSSLRRPSARCCGQLDAMSSCCHTPSQGRARGSRGRARGSRGRAQTCSGSCASRRSPCSTFCRERAAQTSRQRSASLHRAGQPFSPCCRAWSSPSLPRPAQCFFFFVLCCCYYKVPGHMLKDSPRQFHYKIQTPSQTIC